MAFTSWTQRTQHGSCCISFRQFPGDPPHAHGAFSIACWELQGRAHMQPQFHALFPTLPDMLLHFI